MAAICPSSILACGLRVTLLDDLGAVSADPNNYWVSDKLIQITVSPDVEAGPDTTLRGGCNCIVATAKFPDLLKRFNFEISLAAIEPGLLSMMTGAAIVLEGTGDPIGLNWPTGIDCAASPPPNVALEVWSQAWDGDHQDATLPYIHWVWPMTHWQIGQSVLSTDFFTPVLTGFSEGNPEWGIGPYGDDSGSAVGDNGGFWFTATAPPTAECDYQTVVP